MSSSSPSSSIESRTIAHLRPQELTKENDKLMADYVTDSMNVSMGGDQGGMDGGGMQQQQF